MKKYRFTFELIDPVRKVKTTRTFHELAWHHILPLLASAIGDTIQDIEKAGGLLYNMMDIDLKYLLGKTVGAKVRMYNFESKFITDFEPPMK